MACVLYALYSSKDVNDEVLTPLVHKKKNKPQPRINSTEADSTSGPEVAFKTGALSDPI